MEVADVTSVEVDAPQSPFLPAEVVSVVSQMVSTSVRAFRREPLACFCDSEQTPKKKRNRTHSRFCFLGFFVGKHFNTHFEMSSLEFCRQEDNRKEFRSREKKMDTAN